MDNFIYFDKDLQNYRIDLENKFNEKTSLSDINDELSYIFSLDDNIYELKAILRKNKLSNEAINKINKDALDKWFKKEYDIQFFQNCNLDSYCKLNILNEYFVANYSSNFFNSFDMNFLKKESEYIINGEIDLNKIYTGGNYDKRINNYSYKKKNMLKGVERGLYRRNNDVSDKNIGIEKENIVYKRYS